MGLLRRILNRFVGDGLEWTTGPSGAVAPPGEAKPTNPADALGDPLRSLTLDRIRFDYRLRLTRGDLSIVSWALHEALRIVPIIANYERIWTDSLAGMDWAIKTTPDADEAKAEKQADALRAAYDRLDVPEVVRHLARANLYGFSVLQRNGAKLDPLDWWNIHRRGHAGEWLWNPRSRQVYLRGDQPVPPDMAPLEDVVVREVENAAILEYLEIYLSASENAKYWDRYNERRSWNQVVLLTGSVPKDRIGEFEAAAKAIAEGRSGYLAKGSPENPTEVHYPGATSDPTNWQARLRHLDEQACKVLFGAPLIANAEGGSGTLAGSAHADTARKRIQGAALDISATMQRQYDTAVLTEAGLLPEGETPLVYWELVDRRAVDPEQEIKWTAQLAAAGYRRDVEELSERTGITLTEAPTQPQADAGRAPTLPPREGGLGRLFANREPEAVAGGIRDRIGLRRLAAWDAPVREYMEKLVADLDDGAFDEAALDRLENAIRAMPPDLPDAEALAKFLEQAMAGAVVQAVADAGAEG
jgi:hypothetical protein